MIDAAAAAALGFVLGVRHAADADHVVAVTAIVARHGSVRQAVRVGALWGVGHSVTLLAVGGTIVALRLAVPPRVGLGFELLVALVLVAVGVRNLRPGAATDADAHPAVEARRPLLVGTVHGLAGSAAAALLALAAIPTAAWALAYLAVFGAGTVVGMMLVTTLVAAPAAIAAPRLGRMRPALRIAAGALSVVVGVTLAHGIVADGGLFGAVPRWTPH